MTTFTTYEYITNARTDEVHLTTTGTDSIRTLCGRDLFDPGIGDETVSGIAATCQTCRKAIAKRIRAEHRAQAFDSLLGSPLYEEQVGPIPPGKVAATQMRN